MDGVLPGDQRLLKRMQTAKTVLVDYRGRERARASALSLCRLPSVAARVRVLVALRAFWLAALPAISS